MTRDYQDYSFFDHDTCRYGNVQISTHSDPGFLPLLEISWEEWSLADASKQAEDVVYLWIFELECRLQTV